MTFIEFIQVNSLSNIAIIFLAGIVIGVFGFKLFSKAFWILLVLAILFAGSKTSYLKDRWPFNKINQDQITKSLGNKAYQTLKDQAVNELKK